MVVVVGGGGGGEEDEAEVGTVALVLAREVAVSEGKLFSFCFLR